MKVRIRHFYPDFLSAYHIIGNLSPLNIPYRIIDRAEDLWPEWMERLGAIIGEFVANRFFHDEVIIEKKDSWSVDTTLAPIIAPLIRQLKATTHSCGQVDDADVPEYLCKRADGTPYDYNDCYSDSDDEATDLLVARWNWVLDEIIYAMEAISNQFHGDDLWENTDPMDNNNISIYRRDQERIDNGCYLFGRYFRSLWD